MMANPGKTMMLPGARMVAKPWDLLQVCCRFEGTGPSTKRFSNLRAGNPNNVAGDAVQQMPQGKQVISEFAVQRQTGGNRD